MANNKNPQTRRRQPRKPRKAQPKKPNVQPNPKMTTISRVQDSLARGPMAAKMGNTFATCRLQPLSAPNSGMLYPDGVTARRLVIDHRAQFSINCSANMNPTLRFLPSPQYPMVVKTGGNGTLTVNGINYVQNTTGANAYAAWGAVTGFPGWGQTVAGTTASLSAAPFNATACRIVSAEVRIVYTGAANAAQGLVQVQQNPVLRSSDGAPTLVPIFPISRLDVVGAASSVGPTTVLAPSYGGLSYVAPDMVSFRPEVGVSFLLRQTSESIPFQPIPEVARWLIESGSNESYLTDNLGILAWDPSWTGCDVRLFNCSSASSYVVDVVYCVEYQVAPSSDVATIAHAPPAANVPLISTLQSFVATLPSAETIAQAASRAQRFMTYARKGVSLARSAASIASTTRSLAMIAL